MNASQSPHDTVRSAIAYGWRNTRWRGDSLSNAKPAAVVTDLDEPTGWSVHCDGSTRRAPSPSRRVRYAGRSGFIAQDVLDVHQQQLLVLLLVMQPELDERRELGRPSSSITSSIAASTWRR